MKTLIISLFTLLLLTGCSSNTNPVAGGDSVKKYKYTVEYVINNRDTYFKECDDFKLVDTHWIIENDTLQADEVTYLHPETN